MIRPQPICPADVSTAKPGARPLDRQHGRPEQQLRTVRDRRPGQRGDGEQRIRLALEPAQEAAGHSLRHVGRHPLQLGAVEHLDVAAERPLDRRLPLDVAQLRLVRGDEQPTADVDLEVRAELLRQAPPELDGVAQQRQASARSPAPSRPRAPGTARAGSARAGRPRCGPTPGCSGRGARRASPRRPPSRGNTRRRSP